MRIAVTYQNGEVYQHFGHTELFRLYDVENGRVVHKMTIRPTNAGHEAMAKVLQKAGADLLICGGIGDGAQKALQAAGIGLYAGVSGNSDEAVNALLSGVLRYETGSTCQNHGSCGHECGDHGDGEGCGCGHDCH